MAEKGAKSGTSKPRKSKKTKSQSNQRSLLDHFSIKNTAKTTAPSAIPEVSAETSSDAELVLSEADVPAQSSSPAAINVDENSTEGIEYFTETELVDNTIVSDDSAPNTQREDDILVENASQPYRNTRNRAAKKPQAHVQSSARNVKATSSRAKRPPDPPESKDDVSQSQGSSRDAPIVIDSPVKQSHSATTNGSQLRKASRPNSPIQRVRKKKPDTSPSSIPYPDRTSQHVRGAQTSFSRPDLPLGRRDVAPHMADSASDFSWSQLDQDRPFLSDSSTIFDTAEQAPSPSTSATITDTLKDIPLSHRLSPAVSRLYDIVTQASVSSSPSPSSNTLWTDKWHPTCANEVLGNETNALYLRDWLVTLSLQKNAGKPSARNARGMKRPLIVREASKQRKRRKKHHDDRWNSDANDTDDDDNNNNVEDIYSDFEKIDDLPSSPPRRRLRRATDSCSAVDSGTPTEVSEDEEGDIMQPSLHRPFQFGKQVCNTILLSGPSGCGKTAAVYACAEELGWEIFEVYPGMGERSGAALNKLIGDVGKNHLVQKGQSGHLDQFMTAGSRKPVPGRLRRVMSDEDVHLNVQDPSEILPLPSSEPANTSVNTVRQSFVLVEEVDVLYKSDSNFWPTLISIIKDCQRPVVMTCNDLSLVPCIDLPLQATLTFSPCPSSLVTSYLQLLCLAENRPMQRSSITTLYERADRESAAGPPDLRHAIVQLQFGLSIDGTADRASTPAHTDESIQTGHTPDTAAGVWKLLDRVHDSMSYLDAYVQRQATDATNTVKNLLADTSWDPMDNLMGLPLLSDRDTAFGGPALLSVYDVDERISAQAFSYAHDLLRGTGLTFEAEGPDDDDAAPCDAHQSQMVAILERFRVPLEFWKSPVVPLDYEPWIRRMMLIDEVYQREQAEKDKADRSRKTRNSQGYRDNCQQLWVLEPDHRRVLAASPFAQRL